MKYRIITLREGPTIITTLNGCVPDTTVYGLLSDMQLKEWTGSILPVGIPDVWIIKRGIKNAI